MNPPTRPTRRSPLRRSRSLRHNSKRVPLLLAGALLAASFPGGVSASGPGPGDALVGASIGEPSTLIPILASDSASADVAGLIFNGLVKYGPDMRLTGDLAERWEIGQGGLEIVFHLRRNVRWHDGTPFTSEDVRFTYERLIDPNVPTPYRGDFERVRSLEAVDPWTVRIVYKEPFAPGLSSWGMGIIPKHLLEGQDLMATPFRANPVGTGPFRFRRWLRGDRIELESNPDYFEGEPRIRWYVYRIIPDQATIFLELQAQGVDQAGLTPLQHARMAGTGRFDAAFQKFRYPSFGYTYLGWNLRDPKFQDREVRRALNLAINKKEIVQGVLFGLGKESTGPFPHKSWAYNPAVEPAPYDPDRALAMLEAAGWRDSNGDGVLDKDGRPFEFTILTNQGNLPRELTAQIIQRQLARVGVRVKIRVLEWASLLHQFIDKRRFEAVLMGWSLGLEPDPYDIWHSSKTAEGEFNFIGFADPRVDRLMEEGRRSFELPERTRAYHEIHRILYEEQPVCFLYVGDALPVVHRRFKRVEVTPIGIGYNLIEWYVPPGERRHELAP